MDTGFKNYRFDAVYLDTSAEQRAAITRFWLTEQAIADPRLAEQRAHEVVLMVFRADTNELVGVSSVGLSRNQQQRLYYTYRMFIRAADRVPYLMWSVVTATREFLEGYTHPSGAIAGLIHINENPKLMKPGIRRFFLRHGYHYGGKNQRGQDRWLIHFNSPGENTP